MRNGFGGATLLSQYLAEKEKVIAPGEFVALEEGLGKSGAEVVDGEVWLGTLEELLSCALGGRRRGLAGPASGKGRAGRATFFGGCRCEFSVGNDLLD